MDGCRGFLDSTEHSKAVALLGVHRRVPENRTAHSCANTCAKQSTRGSGP